MTFPKVSRKVRSFRLARFMLNHPPTPGQSQTGTDGGLVLSHPSSERLELWDVTGFRSFQPCLQVLTTAFTHHLEKRLHQLIRRLNLGTGLPDLQSCCLLLLMEICGFPQKQRCGTSR